MTITDYHIKLNNADSVMIQEWFKVLRKEPNDYKKAVKEQEKIYRNYRAWCRKHGETASWLPIREALEACTV